MTKPIKMIIILGIIVLLLFFGLYFLNKMENKQLWIDWKECIKNNVVNEQENCYKKNNYTDNCWIYIEIAKNYCENYVLNLH